MVIAITAQCSPPNVWDLAHGSCIDTVSLEAPNSSRCHLIILTGRSMEILWCFQYFNRNCHVRGSYRLHLASQHEDVDSGHGH